MKTPRILLPLLLAPLAVSAQVVYEGFNYTAGTNTASGTAITTTGSAATGTGLTGDWVMNRGGATNVNGSSFASGSLSYGSLSTTGGKLQWDGVQASAAAGNRLTVQLSSSATTALSAEATSKTVWMSYLVNANNTGYGAEFGVYLYNNGISGDTTGAPVFGLGLTGTNARIAYNNTAATGAFAANATSTYWLVGNFTYSISGADTTFSAANLWVFDASSGNPPSVAGSLGTATASWSGTSTSAANRTPTYLGFYTNSSVNDPQFDEVRIGTSYADVAAIPEPSAFAALAGFVCLGLAALRRRRRA